MILRIWSPLLLIALILFVACGERKADPTGAWTSPEAYQAWKKGASEDIEATRLEIGNQSFLVLTNSTIVDVVSPEKFLHVPGGKWRIGNVNEVSDRTVILELHSFTDEEAVGKLTMNFLTDDSFYFTVESMNEGFRSEFKQAFLEPGKDFLYVRCDKVSGN